MGIAVSDTPIRYNDPLGSQPLLFRKRRGGKKQTPIVCIKTSKCAELLLGQGGGIGTGVSSHSPSCGAELLQSGKKSSVCGCSEGVRGHRASLGNISAVGWRCENQCDQTPASHSCVWYIQQTALCCPGFVGSPSFWEELKIDNSIQRGLYSLL